MRFAERREPALSWAIEDLERASAEQQRLFWLVLETTLTEDEGVVAAHLRAGRPVYTRERGTPGGTVIKTYPDGRRELVVPAIDDGTPDRVIDAIT